VTKSIEDISTLRVDNRRPLDEADLLRTKLCERADLENQIGRYEQRVRAVLLDGQIANHLTNMSVDTGAHEEIPHLVTSLSAASDDERRAPTDAELREVFEGIKADYRGGIVQIADDKTSSTYKRELADDPRAGMDWPSVRSRLFDNGLRLLRQASKLPGGGSLVGVFPDGALGIVQRASRVIGARWTNLWFSDFFDWGESSRGSCGGDPNYNDMPYLDRVMGGEDWCVLDELDPDRIDRGTLMLRPHAELLRLETGRWANPLELASAIFGRGLYLPVHVGTREKTGAVAAVEAVTGSPYVEPHGHTVSAITSRDGTANWFSAIRHLSAERKPPKCHWVEYDSGLGIKERWEPNIYNAHLQTTFPVELDRNRRDPAFGAVLWARG
jgi:hypothetical protein